jgi:hypothetical protein
MFDLSDIIRSGEYQEAVEAVLRCDLLPDELAAVDAQLLRVWDDVARRLLRVQCQRHRLEQIGSSAA